MTLKAGVGIRDITPRKPMFLAGYPHVPRISTGIHDPLYASALYMENGSNAIMCIAVDILFISHDIARSCRSVLSRMIGVPSENILISATHTHSGPLTLDMLAWRDDPVVMPMDPEYVEYLSKGIIDAGIAAHTSSVPAQAAVTRTKAMGVGGNRLSPDGITDPEVGILFVKRKSDDRALALDMVYSMHPTVMHEDSTLISSDFPGYTRQHLEEHLPGIKVLYHTGPCGNQSPRYHISGQTFAEADRLGRKLGEAVLAAVTSLDDSDFSDELWLSGAHAFVELPGRTFPSVAEAEAALKQAVEQYRRLKDEEAAHGPLRTAECAVFGAEEVAILAQAQANGEVADVRKNYLPVEVQVLRVGDAFFVGLPGELFVEYGLAIKQRAPGRAFVISLSNGELQGYIVTPEADAAGGYEAALNFFTPEAGSIMADAALDLMRRMNHE